MGVLFVFAYTNPAFAPLFALPLNKTPRHRTTDFIYCFTSQPHHSGCGVDLGRLRRFDLRVKAKPRTEIRIRSRGRVMRTRTHEPRIRTIIRITAEQNTTTSDNRFFYCFTHQPHRSGCGVDFGRLRRFDLRVKAKPRTEIRTRNRGRVRRRRIHDPRIRTRIRSTAEQNTTFGFAA